jgi:hypothetical protein
MFFSGLYFPPKHYGKNIRSASGFFIAGNPFVKIPGFLAPYRSPWLGNPSVFYTFYLVYIWHCRIKLFLRHLHNCPCSNFSLYVDLFQEISPRITRLLNSYLPSNYFNVSIFRWSLCHFYEIIRLLLCFFSGLYFPFLRHLHNCHVRISVCTSIFYKKSRRE